MKRKAPQNTKKARTLPKEAEPYKWQPGQSGNPGGRPKGKVVSKFLIELLEIAKKGGKQQAEEVAQAIIDGAKKNPSFANILLDRTEGSVVQMVQVGELESLPQEMAEGRKRAIEAALKSKKSKEK